MGIIIKQTIRGSFWSYFGTIIGFVTTSYLFPNYLTTDTIGLFSLLVAYSTLFGQFALLGVQGITARLFPHFRDRESGHHGFLFITVIFMSIGFSLFMIAYVLFSPVLIETNLNDSRLFADYLYLLVPLTFFTMIFTLFDTYNKVLYDAVTGTFLQEFFQRVLIFFITLFFIFRLIDLNQLIISYALVVCLKGIFILLFLYYRGELHFRPELKFISKAFRKELIDVALYSVLGGLGSMVVFKIDKIMINEMLDLGNTGVYTIAFYFGTLVVIPSRPLLKISGTLIADAWARDDVDQVKSIYYKSCITQFLIGSFLFLGIWTNIDNILTILGDKYVQSRWVIFFVGLGYLIDMMTGANGHVIGYSKHYRVALHFISILVVLVVALLYIFIPLWGITGAAVAIAIALLLNNLMRFYFLYLKYRMQPFNYRYLLVTAFFTGLYFLLELIPQQYFIWDILLRGALVSVATGLFLLVVPVSEDVSNMIKSILTRVKKGTNG